MCTGQQGQHTHKLLEDLCCFVLEHECFWHTAKINFNFLLFNQVKDSLGLKTSFSRVTWPRRQHKTGYKTQQAHKTTQIKYGHSFTRLHDYTVQSQDPIELVSLSFIIDLNSPRVTRWVSFKSFCTSFQVDRAENLKVFLSSSVLTLGTCSCMISWERWEVSTRVHTNTLFVSEGATDFSRRTGRKVMKRMNFCPNVRT